MITENVSDPLDEDFKCALISFCTLKTSPDYQLKPARGMKTQTAFVVIADVLEDESAEKPPVFLVESLEKIPDGEAEAAPDHIVVLYNSLLSPPRCRAKTRRGSGAGSEGSRECERQS